MFAWQRLTGLETTVASAPKRMVRSATSATVLRGRLHGLANASLGAILAAALNLAGAGGPKPQPPRGAPAPDRPAAQARLLPSGSTFPNYRVFYNATARPAFRLLPSAPGAAGAPAPPQAKPHGFDQISVGAFDSSTNALRVNAAPQSGGAHTPSDADQVFTSIFDPANNAIRVNCVLGCGGFIGSVASAK